MARAMRIPGAHAVAVLPLRDASAVADLLAAVTALVGPTGPTGPTGTADWDDLVFTGGPWFHVIRVLPDGGEPRVLHLTVDRRTGNLALARRELRALAARTPPGRAAGAAGATGAAGAFRPARRARRPGARRPAPGGLAPRVPERTVPRRHRHPRTGTGRAAQARLTRPTRGGGMAEA